MKTITLITLFALCFTITAPLCADEGMWTFDNPPRKAWKDKYNFEPSPAWLDHLRLATVKVGAIGTGSFVSSDGLIMTNQHVGHDSVAKLSTAERDLVKHGFYATTRREELPCPDLDITVLTSFENVSEFDSNLQKLPNRYLYIDESEGSRAVGVHSAAILEALQKLYGAGALVREISGG